MTVWSANLYVGINYLIRSFSERQRVPQPGEWWPAYHTLLITKGNHQITIKKQWGCTELLPDSSSPSLPLAPAHLQSCWLGSPAPPACDALTASSLQCSQRSLGISLSPHCSQTPSGRSRNKNAGQECRTTIR